MIKNGKRKTLRNMKKTVFLVALMMALTILLTACSSGKIEGTWKLTGATGEVLSTVTTDGSISMAFENGRYYFIADGVKDDDPGTYKTAGDKVTFDDEVTAEYRVNGDTLTITFADGTMTLTKTK